MFKLTIRNVVLALAIMAGWCTAVSAQDPTTLPLADLSGVQAAGTYTWDWPDGAGGDLSYGGGALGVSEDGNFVYISCVQDHAGIAKLSIPATRNGARMLPVQPCLGPRKADIAVIHPDPNAFRPMLGGVVEYGGRICVVGYISYDATGATTASHWCGTSLTTLAGPYAGSVSPGLVKSQMFVIPSVWRTTLGGPVASTAGYTSIISRSSYGASISVFDPTQVTGNGFPMQYLLGCRHTDPGCNTYGTPTSNDYNGSELSGGMFIVPGTRTLVSIERESSGRTCYGYTTTNPALDGVPYLDAEYCYSLSDPLDQKGPKGYPYRLVAKLYDLNELVAVKNGTKQPWTIRQYATIDLPGSSASEFITSGAYNPVRGELYLLRGVGGGVNTMYVYTGFAAGVAAPPTSSDCVLGTTAYTFINATACVGSTRTVNESWVRTGDVPPTGNGAACPATTGTRARVEACTPPPPAPTPEFSGRIRAQALVGAGLRITLQVPAAAPPPAIGTAIRVIVNNLPYNGTVFDVDRNYYSGTPRDTRVIVTVPTLNFLSLTVQIP